MSHHLNRELVSDGVYFSSVTDLKFKHNRITVNLVVPLENETATRNAIIPFLLRKGCRSCPDFTKLNRRLCELYGASLSCDVSKFGAYQVLELSIYSIDDRFALDGGHVTAECASLLTEILLEPKLTEGLFGQEDVELEKQQVIDAIESLLNEKRAYALSRCRAAMCKGEAVAIEKYGNIEDARALTSQDATEAYRTLLERARVEIIFVGCGNPVIARDIFAKAFTGTAFAGLTRRPCSIVPTPRHKTAKSVQEITEQMEVAQGKLVLGFSTKECSSMEELQAMRLMTALYGGTPNSRLFVYVREKLSLCYYCAARFDRLTGLLYVDSGVEFANRQKAQEEILRQLELVRAGEFSDEEVTAARLLMKTSLAAVTDSLGAIEDWYMTQIMNGTNYAPIQESELLDRVTTGQLLEAAGRVSLDTIYFLTGKEGR